MEVSILIADDDPMSQQIFAQILPTEGYSVHIAQDGRAAMELLQKHKFTLILLDIEMPNLNGFEVLRLVRQNYSMMQRPVIMVTAQGDRSDILKAYDLGANDYVTKPIDIQVVLARIRAHIAMQKEKRE